MAHYQTILLAPRGVPVAAPVCATQAADVCEALKNMDLSDSDTDDDESTSVVMAPGHTLLPTCACALANTVCPHPRQYGPYMLRMHHPDLTNPKSAVLIQSDTRAGTHTMYFYTPDGACWRTCLEGLQCQSAARKDVYTTVAPTVNDIPLACPHYSQVCKHAHDANKAIYVCHDTGATHHLDESTGWVYHPASKRHWHTGQTRCVIVHEHDKPGGQPKGVPLVYVGQRKWAPLSGPKGDALPDETLKRLMKAVEELLGPHD